jgi:hypothetical protein
LIISITIAACLDLLEPKGVVPSTSRLQVICKYKYYETLQE